MKGPLPAVLMSIAIITSTCADSPERTGAVQEGVCDYDKDWMDVDGDGWGECVLRPPETRPQPMGTSSTTSSSTSSPSTTTTSAATTTTEFDPGLFAAVNFYEVVTESQRTPPFESGSETFAVLMLDQMDWTPFNPPGDGTWQVVRYFNHGQGSIEPVGRFTTPNDDNIVNVSVDVVGDGIMRYPYVVFRWCCPMGLAYRHDEMVTVTQLIDRTLVEVTTGRVLSQDSPVYWANEISPDGVELDFLGTVTSVSVGSDGIASP